MGTKNSKTTEEKAATKKKDVKFTFATKEQMVIATDHLDTPGINGDVLNVCCKDEKGLYLTSKMYASHPNLLDPYRQYHRIQPSDEFLAKKGIVKPEVVQLSDPPAEITVAA